MPFGFIAILNFIDRKQPYNPLKLIYRILTEIRNCSIVGLFDQKKF